MTAKKRAGRPPKAEEDRKDVNFTFRSRRQMRERLKAAADGARRSVSEEIEIRLERSFWQEEIERDTTTLQVRLPERLRGLLEQAAKDNERSMNTEIFDRLDSSFQREELEKHIGGVIEQTAHSAAANATRRLVQELRQSGLIPDQNARPLEATQHPAPPDKEEHSK
jgi:predicted HicB family RNase H-like nuclease